MDDKSRSRRRKTLSLLTLFVVLLLSLAAMVIIPHYRSSLRGSRQLEDAADGGDVEDDGDENVDDGDDNVEEEEEEEEEEEKEEEEEANEDNQDDRDGHGLEFDDLIYIDDDYVDDYYAYEEDDGIRHLEARDIFGFLLASMGVTLAAGGGIGGGGIVVPVYIIVMGLSPRDAIPISSVTVFGGALATLCINARKRHPLADRPLIDWNLVLVMEPLVLAGALVGTMLHRVLSEKLTIVLLVALLSVTAHTTLSKARRMHQAETVYIEKLKIYHEEQRQSHASIPKPIKLPDNHPVLTAPRHDHTESPLNQTHQGTEPSSALLGPILTASQQNQPALSPLNQMYISSALLGPILTASPQNQPAPSPLNQMYPSSALLGPVLTASPQNQPAPSPLNQMPSPLNQMYPGILKPSRPGSLLTAPHDHAESPLNQTHEGTKPSSALLGPVLTASRQNQPAPSPLNQMPSPLNQMYPGILKPSRSGSLGVKARQEIMILNPDFVSIRSELLEEEKVTPRDKIIALCTLFFVLIFLNIMVGGGAFQSPWGIVCGSVAFWVVQIIMGSFLVAMASIGQTYLVNRHQMKELVSFDYVTGDIRWDSRGAVIYPLLFCATGLCAGVFGIGGGMITVPLLLTMGIHPVVTTATSSCMILFTSFSSVTSFAIFDLILWDYAVVCLFVGFFPTLLGQLLMKRAREAGDYKEHNFERNSIIAYSIGGVVLLSALLMTIQYVLSIVQLDTGGEEQGGVCEGYGRGTV